MKLNDEFKIPPYSKKETVEYDLNKYKLLCMIFLIVTFICVVLGSIILAIYRFWFKDIIVIDYIALALFLVGLVTIILYFIFEYKLSHYFKNQAKREEKFMKKYFGQSYDNNEKNENVTISENLDNITKENDETKNE